MTRLDRIRRRVQAQDGDAILISFLPDIRWAIGFTGSNGILIVTHDEAHFVTDGRYVAQAHEEVLNATVHTPGYQLVGHIAQASLLGEASRVLLQAEHTTLAQLDQYKDGLPGMDFVPVTGFLAEEVAAKDETEIDALRAAQSVTDAVFETILPLIQPGMSESDLAAEIVYQHLKSGCEGMAFDPIVASGLRSALPHARATSRTFRRGECVLVDMGGVLNGYASDMTRTVFLGAVSDEARAVYHVVLDAQEAALEFVAAGKTGREVDQAARSVIEAAGFGPQFSHSLGHGIGLQTHEWPRVSARAEDVIPAGAAVTIEPGIYLPERFGVRIEDLVIVREGGHENLTASSKELLVI